MFRASPREHSPKFVFCYRNFLRALASTRSADHKHVSVNFATLQPALRSPSKLRNLKYDSADGLKYM